MDFEWGQYDCSKLAELKDASGYDFLCANWLLYT